jgi:hypothetical protein
MNIGDAVNLKTYGWADRSCVVIAKGIPSGISNLTAYEIDFHGLRFYMKPELGTRKHMNVGNSAYWIEPIQ